jgi:hypothetical protein
MNWKVLWKEMVVEYVSSQAFAWINLGKTNSSARVTIFQAENQIHDLPASDQEW